MNYKPYIKIDYRISRARDGRLTVRIVDPQVRRRRWGWLLAGSTSLAVGLVFAPVTDVISLARKSIEQLARESALEGAITGHAADSRTGSGASDGETVTLELPLPQKGKQGGGAGPVREADAAAAPPGAADPPLALAPDIDSAISPTPAAAADTAPVAPPMPSDEPPAAVDRTVVRPLQTHRVEVASGDSLSAIFDRLELDQSELLELASGGEGEQLKRLRPGEVLELKVDAEGSVQELIYRPDQVRAVHFRRTEEGFASEFIERPYESRSATAQGVIEHSLFVDASRAGLSDRTIMELAEIFGWDVDFALDIRSGDRFSVVYEELFHEGEKVRDGAILAAEFVNRGRTLRALRYVDPRGRAQYFTPEGQSMRKAFLRTPLKFTRISSRFNLKRKHPILHTIRAHKGVDYAAPHGTPVKATGDGTVSFVGNKGGYGKTIILRHGSTYTTLYAHLSRYARGLARGRPVEQGQVIGYVGASGLATGPHLHYEFRVRDVHQDPLTVQLPEAQPIAAEYREDFLSQVRGLLARLETLSRLQLAAKTGE